MGNLNFNNLFIGLSVEQIVVLLVLVVVSILFGLMAGASIFYPAGYRRCRKDGKAGSSAPQSESAPYAEATPAPAVQQTPVEVPDTFDEEDSYDYTSDDLFNFVDDEEPVVEEPVVNAAEPLPTQEPVVEEPTPAVAEQPAPQPEPVRVVAAPVAASRPEPAAEQPAAEPIVDDAMVVPALMDVAPGTGEQIQVVGEPLRDDVFVHLEERRKQMVPIINRTVLVNYGKHMTPLANSLPIVVTLQDKAHPYDRLAVKDYTFAVVFEHNKVLRLVLRLHANTIGALRQAAGSTVAAESAFGEDWYSWVVTDIEHCEKVVAKVLDMSYKYVAHATYKRGKDGGFVPKVASYEEAVAAAADAYVAENDAVYMALAGQMNAKYQLHYFGKKEAQDYAKTIAGKLPVSIEDAGNLAVFKAGGYMFAAVYESYGVVKMLFRADKEYVDVLHAEHPYVGCSEIPKSEYRQWYYAILDKTFDDEQCTQILLTAYQNVVAKQE